nr:MAG TPA: Cell density-dependent motility repressor [Caudoviricetes sp.]
MINFKSEPKAAGIARQVASKAVRKPHIRLTPEVCLLLREISNLRSASYVAHVYAASLSTQLNNLESKLEDKLETVYHFCL